MNNKRAPLFRASQFTSTPFDTAEQKAEWANKMASWVLLCFRPSGWTRYLYHDLSLHMFGHIAHYDARGFYQVWFSDVHKQLRWLEFAAKGGTSRFAGDASYTWSDVERAFSDWVSMSDLVAAYTELCQADIEQQERAQLAALMEKYPLEETTRA